MSSPTKGKRSKTRSSSRRNFLRLGGSSRNSKKNAQGEQNSSQNELWPNNLLELPSDLEFSVSSTEIGALCSNQSAAINSSSKLEELDCEIIGQKLKESNEGLDIGKISVLTNGSGISLGHLLLSAPALAQMQSLITIEWSGSLFPQNDLTQAGIDRGLNQTPFSLSRLSILPNLKSLKITNAGLTSAKFLLGLPQLVNADLSHNLIADLSDLVVPSPNHYPLQLQSLNLAFNIFSDWASLDLSRLTKNSAFLKLASVNVTGNPICANGPVVIQEHPPCKIQGIIFENGPRQASLTDGSNRPGRGWDSLSSNQSLFSFGPNVYSQEAVRAKVAETSATGDLTSLRLSKTSQSGDHTAGANMSALSRATPLPSAPVTSAPVSSSSSFQASSSSPQTGKELIDPTSSIFRKSELATTPMNNQSMPASMQDLPSSATSTNRCFRTTGSLPEMQAAPKPQPKLPGRVQQQRSTTNDTSSSGNCLPETRTTPPPTRVQFTKFKQPQQQVPQQPSEPNTRVASEGMENLRLPFYESRIPTRRQLRDNYGARQSSHKRLSDPPVTLFSPSFINIPLQQQPPLHQRSLTPVMTDDPPLPSIKTTTEQPLTHNRSAHPGGRSPALLHPHGLGHGLLGNAMQSIPGAALHRIPSLQSEYGEAEIIEATPASPPASYLQNSLVWEDGGGAPENLFPFQNYQQTDNIEGDPDEPDNFNPCSKELYSEFQRVSYTMCETMMLLRDLERDGAQIKSQLHDCERSFASSLEKFARVRIAYILCAARFVNSWAASPILNDVTAAMSDLVELVNLRMKLFAPLLEFAFSSSSSSFTNNNNLKKGVDDNTIYSASTAANSYSALSRPHQRETASSAGSSSPPTLREEEDPLVLFGCLRECLSHHDLMHSSAELFSTFLVSITFADYELVESESSVGGQLERAAFKQLHKWSPERCQQSVQLLNRLISAERCFQESVSRVMLCSTGKSSPPDSSKTGVSEQCSLEAAAEQCAPEALQSLVVLQKVKEGHAAGLTHLLRCYMETQELKKQQIAIEESLNIIKYQTKVATDRLNLLACGVKRTSNF